LTTHHRIGALTLDRIVESEFPVLAPAEVYPDCTAAHIEDNLDWLAPRFYDTRAEKLILAFQGFVIRSGGKTILVDTCVGDCKERRRADFHQQQWGWLAKLRAAGFDPDRVDTVVCTHFHVDHVGWNTRLENGRWVPTFPNARYLFAQAEWDYWHSDAGRPGRERTGDYMGDSILPVVAAGLVDFVATDHRIDASVRMLPAPGHTPGMVCVALESQGQRAVITGDLLHTVLQLAYPDWSTRFCADLEQSRATRLAFLENHADTDTLIFPAHFPAPTAGIIRRTGDAYVFCFVGEP
jgi:glyoxylase-like metal-dependent hydrolase (beta-lactamase superfamily II)